MSESFNSSLYQVGVSPRQATMTDYKRGEKLSKKYVDFDKTKRPGPITPAGGAIGAFTDMMFAAVNGNIQVGITENDGKIFVEMLLPREYSADGRDDNLFVSLLDVASQQLDYAFYSPSSNALFLATLFSIPLYAVSYFVYQRLVHADYLEPYYNEVLDTLRKQKENGESFFISKCEAVDRIYEYFYGKGLDDLPDLLAEDIGTLQRIPKNLQNVTNSIFHCDEKEFESLKVVEDVEDTEGMSVDEKRALSLSKMQKLRDDAYPLVQDFYENLSDEDKALVPDDDSINGYIPTRLFANVVKILSDSLSRHDMDGQNVLLMGPPGVGKSVMAIALAYVFHMPYRYTQGYKTMDASEYRGTTIAINGTLHTSTDTPFANTVRRGGLFCDDDANYASEGESTVKNSVLIAPYSMTLADQTTIKRHPFSIFVMTANPTQRGARPINEAVKDRHCIIIEMEPMDDEQLKQMVMERSGYEDEDTVSRIIQCWHEINDQVKDSGDGDELSPRTLVNWARETRVLGSPVQAAKYNVLGALCGDKELRDNVLNFIIAPRFKG